MNRRALCAAGAALLGACLDAGQAELEIPLLVAGTAASEPIASSTGWVIELRQAELAFGPLYLCAGYQAGALCEMSRAEWTGSRVVDALSPDAQLAGTLRGVSGPVRSWMYDLGFASLLTQQRPLALDAAQSLGGNSVRIAGVARRDTQTLAFLLELPVQQEEATETGVSVVRKSSTDVFEHELRGDEAALTVRFAAPPWLRDVDFDELASREQAQPAPLTPESQAYRALRSALVAGERPAFEWSQPHERAEGE